MKTLASRCCRPPPERSSCSACTSAIGWAFYEALADAGPVTVAELAERAGIHDRYARKWLEQQAVSGVLAVDEPALPYHRRLEHCQIGVTSLAPHAELVACGVTKVEPPATWELEDRRGDHAACCLDSRQRIFEGVRLQEHERHCRGGGVASC